MFYSGFYLILQPKKIIKIKNKQIYNIPNAMCKSSVSSSRVDHPGSELPYILEPLKFRGVNNSYTIAGKTYTTVDWVLEDFLHMN